MESSVGFLNLEYLLLRSYDFVTTAQYSFERMPLWASILVQNIIILGMVLSFILIVLLVYAQIKLLQTEHEGFHGKEQHHVEHEIKVEEAQKEKKNDRWERIMELASSGNQSDWRRAILESDIMLGDALLQAGYQGPNVGDQLKMTNPIQVTTLDLAWKAHKVRNDVAHGGESFMLSERDMRVAIDYYKRVFEELGAI